MGHYRMPVTLTGTAPGGPYINVWHVQTGAGADDQAVLNAKAALIRTFYTDLNTSITNVGQIIGGSLVVSADFATEVSSGLQQPLTWSPLTTAATRTQAPQRLPPTPPPLAHRPLRGSPWSSRGRASSLRGERLGGRS